MAARIESSKVAKPATALALGLIDSGVGVAEHGLRVFAAARLREPTLALTVTS